MRIREAVVEDADAIAAVHVRGWQGAYRGVFPDEFLDSMDIVVRAGRWRELLSSLTYRVLVVEMSAGVSDLRQCVRAATATLTTRLVSSPQSTSIHLHGALAPDGS